MKMNECVTSILSMENVCVKMNECVTSVLYGMDGVVTLNCRVWLGILWCPPRSLSTVN